MHTLIKKAIAQTLSIGAAGGMVLLVAVLVLPKEKRRGGEGHRGTAAIEVSFGSATI